VSAPSKWQGMKPLTNLRKEPDPAWPIDLILSIAIIAGTFVYIWCLALGAKWSAVFLVPPIILLWRVQRQTVFSLGLAFSEFRASFRRWRVLWVFVIVVFLVLQWRVLLQPRAIYSGFVYYGWCVAQQLLYQSVVYVVFRRAFRNRILAVCFAALVFAALHAPNPVLVCGCLLWGVVSSLLFDGCRSVLALALMQVFLSSTAMAITPYEIHRGFRIGPFYRSAPRARPVAMLRER